MIYTKTRKPNALYELSESRSAYLMLAPFTLFFLIFTVLAVVSAMGLSLTNYNLIEKPVFSGWTNYVRTLIDDDILIIAVKNTLMFAIITGPASYILCLFFAWMINELPHSLKIIMTFVFYAPSISGSVYIIWTYIFSSDAYGLVNSLLMRTGLIMEPVLWLADTRYILPIVILVQLWSSLGTSFLAFIAGFQSIDKNLYESGAIDGIKNRFQELMYITLPAMGPQLMFAAVMQIGASFAAGDISVALAGNPSVDYAAHTVVTHISDYAIGRYEMGYACALSTLLFAVMLLTNSGVSKFLRRHTNL